MAGATRGRQRNINDTWSAWGHFQDVPVKHLPRSGNQLYALMGLAGGKRGY